MTQKAAIFSPKQQYEVKVFDVEYRKTADRTFFARIYQPQGVGPFPAMLDVHGGAWSAGDRFGGEVRGNSLASSGLLVAAIDLRIAPEHPCPSQLEDTNYGTRWLKANAKEFNADASRLGIFGISSGGHTAMLSALRPYDSRYAAIPLTENADVDASVAYAVLESPVLDPYARYQYAKETGRESLIAGSEGYFLSEDGMKEGNPQMILERGEEVELPPVLLIQGTADANVPLSIPKRFVEAYGAAGGSIQLELFPDMPHGFGRDASPETERELGLIKEFIAKQLG